MILNFANTKSRLITLNHRNHLLAYLLTHSFTYFSYAFFVFFSGRNKEHIMELEPTKKQKQFFFSKKDNLCLFYILISHCIENLHSLIPLLTFCVLPINHLFLQCCMHPISSMYWNNFHLCCRRNSEYQKNKSLNFHWRLNIIYLLKYLNNYLPTYLPTYEIIPIHPIFSKFSPPTKGTFVVQRYYIHWLLTLTYFSLNLTV